MIANLEHALGVKLFDRGPQGVEPTVYGRALLKRSLAAFDELKQGIRDIEFLADPTTGEIRIACTSGIIATILSPTIEGFSQQYPRVILHVEDLSLIAHQIAGLRDRKYDFGLGRLVMCPHAPLQDDLKTEVLFDDPWVVAVGTQTRWARRRKIDLTEVIEEPWTLAPPDNLLHASMAEAFRKRGCNLPKIRMETSSVYLRAQLAASGKFITAMPKSIAERFLLKAFRIDIQPLSVAIVTLKNRALSPVAERFIEHVREYTRPLRQGRPAQKR